MQEDREEEDEGLVERFQRVLAKMGIRVEIDPDGEGVEVTTNLDDALDGGQLPTQNPPGRLTSRRGSLDSFFDSTADKVPGYEYGQDLPYRSRHGSAAASDIGERRDKRRSRSDSGARSQIQSQLPIRTRVNGHGSRRIASDSLGSRPRRSGSVSSRGSLRIRRDDPTGTQQFDDYDGDDSEQTDSFDPSHIQIPGVNAPIPGYEEGYEYAVPEALYRPSDTQLVRDAQTFDQDRILARAQACLHIWRDQTRASAERREQMNAQAQAFDRRVLLRGSLDSWRIALQNRHQAIETERFFERLENRAGKARNLFLLTKAFTHWAKSTEDEVLRTSTARRHILRTKYFNAWRDITAVNELKIQHFVLRKFLDKWHARTVAVLEQNGMAISLYEHNIVYRLYWQWFWKFGEQRAPLLYRNKLARDTFLKWAEIVGILKEREAWAADQRDREIVRRALGKLRERAASIRSREAEADQFRETALVSSGFYTLRQYAKFLPLEAQVRAHINTRLMRSTLQAWCRNTQLSQQSRYIDRMRILRNAFTSWNDRLRIKAVEDRIDDRLQLECLYKWALASRVALFQRVQNHRLKQTIFSKWIASTRNHEVTLEDAEQRFAAFKRRQLLRSYLQKLERTTVQRKNQEYLALSVYEPKLERRIFNKLLEKYDRLVELDNWAERANYYVTAKSTIKRWQTATEFARRNRRREAYAHMRRTVKMNLVRRMFHTWRDKATQIETQERQANELIENRILRTSRNFLTQWQDRTSTLRTWEIQAAQKYNTKIGRSALLDWTQKFEALRKLNDQAIALRQESTEIAATSCFKKLGWRLWNIQRQEENALALHQRNFDKHVRAMIRFWWEQTSENLAQRPVSPSPSSRPRGGQSRDDEGDDAEEGEHVLDGVGDETHRLEAWTAFDESALGLSNLDLSFSVSPQRHPSHTIPPRPYTQPPPSFRAPPPPIPEIPDLETEGDPGFWTSTPMPLPKPGYLKTPSKRSVVRAKRPELPTSPEKRNLGLNRATMGAASAPPGPGYATPKVATEAITSFETKLREGGFTGTRRGGASLGLGRTGRGRGRVGFGDLG